MKKLLPLLCAATMCGATFAEPLSVEGLTLEKVDDGAQTGFKLSYTVNDINPGDENRFLEVAMTIGDAKYVASNLTGQTSCANGKHEVFWPMAKTDCTFKALNATVTVTYRYPDYCLVDLSGGSDATSFPVSYTNGVESAEFDTLFYKTNTLVLKRVDPGTFIMGKDQTNESHRVTLTKPFYMGLFEYTQKQWALASLPAYANVGNDANGKGDAYPAYFICYEEIRGYTKGVTWPESDAVDSDCLLDQLRTKTGLLFDLPTEAQWEYTCRAGTTTAYSYGGETEDDANGDYMWYKNNSDDKSHVVGTKKPNPWGFYDMHGNVIEICLDRYKDGELPVYGVDPKGRTDGTAHAARGGSFSDRYNDHCFSYYRNDYVTAKGGSFIHGFRLAIQLTEAATNVSAVATWHGEAVDPFPEIAADASASDVAAALEGVADARLKEKITTATQYASYRAWVGGVAGTDSADEAVIGKRQAIKDAAHAWLGYALDLDYDAAVALDPKQGDLVIATFAVGGGAANGSTSTGSWTLTVSLGDISVGKNATAENLAEAFQIEGATTLGGATAFSSSSVTATFAPTSDGKVSVAVKPSDATASTFFIRVKLTP